MSGIDSDLIRGHIDTIILKTLLNGDKYGYEICHDVEILSNAKYELKQPTLYSCLKRLEEKEFITSYWTDSDIGGRRHYYSLTPLGIELYRTNQNNWVTSRNMVDNLISDNKGSEINDGVALEIDGDLLRGNIDTIILKTLVSGHKYGYEICKEIDTKSSGTYELKQPTLYSCLKRLEDKEFITSFWEDSEIGGKRHYYDLSEKGQDLLKENQLNWERSKLVIDNLILSDIELPKLDVTTSTIENNEQNLSKNANIETENEDEISSINEIEADDLKEDIDFKEDDNENISFIDNQENSDEEIAIQPKIDELYDDASFVLEDYEEPEDIPHYNEDNDIEEISNDDIEEITTNDDENKEENFFTDSSIDIPEQEDNTKINEINYIENEDDDDETSYSLDDIIPSYNNCKIDNSFVPSKDITNATEKDDNTKIEKDLQETQPNNNTGIEIENEDTKFDISKFISNKNNYFKAEGSKQNVVFSPKTSDIVSSNFDENDKNNDSNSIIDDNATSSTNTIKQASFFTDSDNINFEKISDKLEVENAEKIIMPEIEKDDDVEKQPERFIDSYPIKYKADAKYRESLDKLTSFTTVSTDNTSKTENTENQEEINRKERREPTSISKLKDKFEMQGISVKLYSHADNEPTDTKTYILTNKIRMVRNWITFFFMSFLLALTYLTLNNYQVVDNTMMGTYIYFIIGFSFLSLFPLLSSIIYLINPFKKHVARFAPRVSILFALLFTVQFLVIIYSINLQLGFTSFTDPLYNHLNYIVPCVITLMLIVESIIYCILYNSKKFHK
ncbi:MAG: helix-turn-helix transcriptional regulator [Clostridia bacterium]